MIERFRTGARVSQAVECNGLVFLAGQVPQADTGPLVRDQTLQVLAKIDELLTLSGSDRSHIQSATIWLTCMGDFAEMNEAWEAWIPAGHTPARATVVSPDLAATRYRIEIGVIAAKI